MRYHIPPPCGGACFFFFSSRLFDRRLSSSKDCFTGQSPGIGHDGSHLYTGGPGEGQVQAGLLRRGLGVCCSGGGGDFSVAFKVMAAREVFVKEGCCEGMHGRVCEHGAPAVDQGVGEGVAE